jgi:hypothetical protein
LPPHSPHRRGRRGAFGLVLVAALLALGTGTPARAQSTDLTAQFGGYRLGSAGNGLLFTYDLDGVFPVSPVFQAGLPEASVAQTNAPSGAALASLAWPGPLIADLGTALAQSPCDPDGEGGNPPSAPPPVPPYPVRAQASYPGETSEQAQETLPGARMEAKAGAESSTATAQYSGADLPTFVRTGAVNVVSNSRVVAGAVESRVRTEITGLNLFAGLVTAQSVVTDMVATSSGTAAASDGGTVVTGLKVLGADAYVDSTGVHLVQTEPAPGTGGPLGSIVGPLLDRKPLQPLTDALTDPFTQVSELINEIVGTGVEGLNELLAQAGVRMRLLEPVATAAGGQAARSTSGLFIESVYDGQTAPVLSQLLAAIPVDQLPADPIPCTPFSPQSMVNLFKQTHISSVSIGSGNVNVTASSPFVRTPISRPPSSLTTGVAGTGSITTPAGFATPTPALSATPGAPAAELATEPISARGIALPALLILLALLSAPLWATGSQKLADNVLAAGVSGCPEGKDGP